MTAEPSWLRSGGWSGAESTFSEFAPYFSEDRGQNESRYRPALFTVQGAKIIERLTRGRGRGVCRGVSGRLGLRWGAIAGEVSCPLNEAPPSFQR